MGKSYLAAVGYARSKRSPRTHSNATADGSGAYNIEKKGKYSKSPKIILLLAQGNMFGTLHLTIVVGRVRDLSRGPP